MTGRTWRYKQVLQSAGSLLSVKKCLLSVIAMPFVVTLIPCMNMASRGGLLVFFLRIGNACSLQDSCRQETACLMFSSVFFDLKEATARVDRDSVLSSF